MAEAAASANNANTCAASPRRGEPAALNEVAWRGVARPGRIPAISKSAGHTTVDVATARGSKTPWRWSDPICVERAGSFFGKFTARGFLAKGPTIQVKICALRKEEAHLANKLPRQMLCPAGMVAMLSVPEACA